MFFKWLENGNNTNLWTEGQKGMGVAINGYVGSFGVVKTLKTEK